MNIKVFEHYDNAKTHYPKQAKWIREEFIKFSAQNGRIAMFSKNGERCENVIAHAAARVLMRDFDTLREEIALEIERILLEAKTAAVDLAVDIIKGVD